MTNDSNAKDVSLTPQVEATVSLRQKLDALSPRAKRWLEKTCEYLDENEPYFNHKPSRDECRIAGLIKQKPFGYIEIPVDVMELVWIERYFSKSN